METVGGLKFPRYDQILPLGLPDVHQPCKYILYSDITACPLGFSFTPGLLPDMFS